MVEKSGRWNEEEKIGLSQLIHFLFSIHCIWRSFLKMTRVFVVSVPFSGFGYACS